MAWQPTTPLAHAVYTAGFEYQGEQDILISRMYPPLQRNTGFCWAYDCLSPALLMILDCECFYFSYGGKFWLIELWKGQYGLETGSEIGVYNCHGVGRLGARGTFFKCALDEERLTMWYRLSRDGEPFIERGPEPHWWLTGFKWGVFTRHSTELVMDIRITFDNKADMCTAFKQALKTKGYIFREIGNTGVAFVFDRPFEHQPAARWAAAPIAQAANERLVARYKELKKERNLSSNDPNGFVPPEQWLDAASRAKELADKAAKLSQQAAAGAKDLQKRASGLPNAAHNEALAAAKKRQEQAAAAAKKIKAGVSRAAQGIEDKVTGETKETYRAITEFFEKMASRTAPSGRH